MATTHTNIANVPPGIATPDRVESRLGTLNFTDGVPDAATAQKLFDELDYVHAVTAFINGYAAVNQLALLKGFRAAGVNDNEVLVTSGLMDAKCLFLTANADTYYMWAYLDLSKGPLVVETPPDTLGIIDDMWWNWVSDFGFPGADRGLGGKYLLLPPGYTGTCPRAASTCASPERITWRSSAARSSRTTIPSRWMRSSRRRSRSIHTSRAAKGRASPAT